MSAGTQIRLPGYGLPLDEMPAYKKNGEKHRFPHAIADYLASEGVTRREQAMLEFMSQVTDKPNWVDKVHDDQIVDKWRDEACGTKMQQEFSDQHLSIACFKYCMQELRDKAAYFQTHSLVHVLDVSATIVKADLAEDDSFAGDLSGAVKALEDIPGRLKDWHPGSDGLVLDLVHPSLFPLKYGISRILPSGRVPLHHCNAHIACGEICPVPGQVQNEAEFERMLCNDGVNLKPWGSFQWLPTDVRLTEQGPRIESYVNNLHPERHQDLYRMLEGAVEKAIPLWTECLSWFHNRLRIDVQDCGFDDFREPSLTIADLQVLHVASEQPPLVDEAEGKDLISGHDAEAEGEVEGEDEDENEDKEEDSEDRNWYRDNPHLREIYQPKPTKTYVPFSVKVEQQGLRRIDLRNDFPEGLQVIFKLANIHLTPEKPRYDGSDWHVEGALNEHICATALFYYDQENIEDSYLEFRHEVDSQDMIMKPGQDEWMAAEDLFGVEMEGPAQQDLGKVLTRKDRILAFPNVMQHRVRSFGLADARKPGYRKILAMFLVDPHVRIVSTANVPPQRRDWWAAQVRKIDAFAALPIELFDRIIEVVDDFPIGWSEACEMREALMAERGRANEDFQEALRQDTFFFCEH